MLPRKLFGADQWCHVSALRAIHCTTFDRGFLRRGHRLVVQDVLFQETMVLLVPMINGGAHLTNDNPMTIAVAPCHNAARPSTQQGCSISLWDCDAYAGVSATKQASAVADQALSVGAWAAKKRHWLLICLPRICTESGPATYLSVSKSPIAKPRVDDVLRQSSKRCWLNVYDHDHYVREYRHVWHNCV